MSDVIKTVFVNYITCALVGGILEYVAPQNARKTLRVAVVSIMLITSFSPILKINIDFSNINSVYENDETQSYDALMHTANLTEKKIYNEMRDILINLEIDEYEIYVKTTVEIEENTVYLDSIKIEVSEKFADKISEIKKSVKEEYRTVLIVEKMV
jgi:hypothetical protein